MAKQLNEFSATEIVAAIGEGRVTGEAVVRACLDRISEREDAVGAWAHLDPDVAIAAARAFDRSGKRGPLAGVPFGVKDIIDTADLPTSWGTPIHAGRQAGRDAACVALSRRAGGILLGKTATTEFANVHPAKTRNPHDVERTPGGSSSGSAAAVADFMVPLAIGTQTTGSTVRPASFCGIIGYRPTYGEHRLHGVMEASGSLDTLGVCARSLDDVALYRDVLLGIPPQPIASGLPAPRIGLCRTHVWPLIEADTRKHVEDAADLLSREGAVVEEMDLPEDFARLAEAHRWISGFEFARTFTWEIDNRWQEISETLREGRIDDGLNCSLELYIEMVELAARCRIALKPFWKRFDVLITAGAYGEAPIGWNAFVGADLYKMWTALHVPSLTLPVFKGPNGMPVGIQVFGRSHGDRELFAQATWIFSRLA